MPLLDSLIAHWKLNEASGTRVDSHRSNDLSDVNTVGQVAGKIDNAAQFVSANLEYLTITDNVDLSLGSDQAFSHAGWMYLDSKGASRTLCGKNSTANASIERIIRYDSGVDRFRLVLYGGGLKTLDANTFGSPSTGTWYFIYVYHDPVADELGISINDGTVDTLAHTGGTVDTAYNFSIGRPGAYSGHYMNGRIDSVSFWKRVLTSAEVTELYNSGAGLDYDSFTASPISRVGSETINNSSTGVTSHSYSHTTTADTDLLLLVIHIEGAESVSGTPTFDGANFTLIHDTGGTGSNTDVRSYIYGMVSPGAKTATISISFTTSVNPSCSICVNYKGTDTASVAAATNFLSEDINTAGTSTNVHASGGGSGNALFISCAGQGADMEPMDFDNSFVEVWDEQTGTSTTSDFGHGGAELLSGLPSAVTCTFGVSDENTGILIELVTATGGTPVSNSVLVPYEVLSAMDKSSSIIQESLAGLSASTASPYEGILGLARSAVVPMEAKNGLAQPVSVPMESLEGVNQPGNVAFESLKAVDSSAPHSYESLFALSASAPPSYESLLGLAAAGLISYEARGTVAQSVQPFWESVGQVSSIGAIPWESISGLVAAAIVPWEAAAGVAAGGIISWEALAQLTADGAVFWEALVPVMTSAPLPWEGLVVVVKADSPAYEAMAGLTSTGAIPWEALALGERPKISQTLRLIVLVSDSLSVAEAVSRDLEVTQAVSGNMEIPS